jgi:cyclic pyranopterin phosphate synthase
MAHKDILSFEEIVEITRKAVQMGVIKVRLTGGEPLVRKGIVTLVKMLSKIDAITDLAMTTNGGLLAEFATPLKKAGLHRLNVSIDTIDPQKYREITRTGRLEDVLNGVSAAQKAGFTRIKINTVIDESPEEANASGVAKYARENGFEIRYIRKMDLSKGQFWPVQGGTGGDCALCNRLRLTSDGYIRPCLFSDLQYSVKELGASQALLSAIQHKPQRGQVSRNTTFCALGG